VKRDDAIKTPEECDAAERLQDLIRRAQAGDGSALPSLRVALDEAPDLWREAGSLADQVQKEMLQQVAGADLILRETMERSQSELRAELSDPDPSPLERLLIERVLICRLLFHGADRDVVRNLKRFIRQATLARR
jgi:hypothetical protein